MPYKTKKTNQHSMKLIAILIFALLAVSIIPLLISSFYNRPYLDDYVYGRATANAWRETKSLWQVFLAAIKVVKDTYRDWQGTYSAVFMFALQPGIFSEQIYFLTTFFLLGFLLLSTFYFLFCVLVVALKKDRWVWLIVSSTVSFLSIQLLPSAFGGFYWYNGTVYYTFYYSLMLFLSAHLTKVPFLANKKQLVYHGLMVLVLAVIVAGGNYMTALMTALIFVFYCAWFSYKRIKGKWIAYLGLLFLLIGLFISAVAPGNTVRAIALDDGGIPRLSIVNTLWRTLLMPGWYALKWISPSLVLSFVLLAPLLWVEARNANHPFPCPLLFLILAYGLYASQYAPPIMMNVLGADRHLNIFFFSFILISIACLYYCFGWFQRRFASLKEKQYLFTNKNNIKYLYAILILLLAFSANKDNWSSISASNSLYNRQIQQFAQQRDARLKDYLDPDIKDVIVEPLTNIPHIFYGDDFQDPDMWVNRAVADFYGKNSVSLAEQSETTF